MKEITHFSKKVKKRENDDSPENQSELKFMTSDGELSLRVENSPTDEYLRGGIKLRVKKLTPKDAKEPTHALLVMKDTPQNRAYMANEIKGNQLLGRKVFSYYNNGKIYGVMPWFSGEELGQLTKRVGSQPPRIQAFPLAARLNMLGDIFGQTYQLHSNNMLNGDPKKENVVVTSNQAHVIDLASCHGPAEGKSTIWAYTQDYLPPELFNKPHEHILAEYSFATEIFENGIIAAYMLPEYFSVIETGLEPCQSKFIGDSKDPVAAGLRILVTNMMHNDPKERPTIKECQDLLVIIQASHECATHSTEELLSGIPLLCNLTESIDLFNGDEKKQDATFYYRKSSQNFFLGKIGESNLSVLLNKVSTTIEDIENLLKALRHQPIWLAKIIKLLSAEKIQTLVEDVVYLHDLVNLFTDANDKYYIIQNLGDALLTDLITKREFKKIIDEILTMPGLSAWNRFECQSVICAQMPKFDEVPEEKLSALHVDLAKRLDVDTSDVSTELTPTGTPTSEKPKQLSPSSLFARRNRYDDEDEQYQARSPVPSF